ncbi:MAG: phosphotransferase [Chloroflexota bacterium]
MTGYLARAYPEVFPQIHALDLQHNWLLMRDSGVSLRSFIKAEGRIDHWQGVLPLYVGLQKNLSDKQQILLQLGVPDRRLSQLPGLFDELLTDEPAMLLGNAEGLNQEEFQRLKLEGREFGDLCALLAEIGIPESLQHYDFHDANIFLQNGRIIFTDWGECAVAHPFFSSVVMLRSVENSLDLCADAEEIETLRGWYLDLWGEYGTTTELRAVASLAERIGYINRALTWHMLISQLPKEIKPEYARAVPAYLKEYLNAG